MSLELETVNWDIEGFIAELDGIEYSIKPGHLRVKSRDYFWYSPILNQELEGRLGDILVMPKSENEIRTLASLIAKFRVPVTIRGGGTGNYGQCVPLEGGVILDITGLNKIVKLETGKVRVQAGMKIAALDQAVRETGQELLMFPSTLRTATIGGFISGGSGGIGSLRHGMLRDPGNVDYIKILTMEEAPKIIELFGDEIQKAHHAYGTNGIILELDLALTPAVDWVHGAALFKDYKSALKFTEAVVEEKFDCYLLTTVERRFAQYYRVIKDYFPEDKDAVFTMIAPNELERFFELAAKFGGTKSFAMGEDALKQNGIPHAYECGWNHTTLMALKEDKSWTYLQVAYPVPFDANLVREQMARYGDELIWHHETAREKNQLQIFALPLVRFSTKERLYEIVAELEKDGCLVFDAHVYTIEDGGMKQIDREQLNFKKTADPHGLMNPGKMRGWTKDMAS